MTFRSGRVLVATVLCVLGFGALPSSSAAPVGLPARVIDFSPDNEIVSYPVLAPDGSPQGEARWRVIERTGNSNENYLAITGTGTLIDFGGTYLNFTEDAGRSWSSVRSSDVFLSGEGAVTVAPGGDVVGIAWEPYSGDRVIPFKYDAASESWLHSYAPVHTPFFDRPWISVIPGPFVVGGQTVPYVSVLRGGWPSKEGWFYSLDGLNYIPGSHRSVETLTGSTTELGLKLDSETDWLQPLASSGYTPLPGGGILAAEGITLAGPLSIMKPPNLRWMDFDFPKAPSGGIVDDALVADSGARIHRVAWKSGRETFTYEMTSDDGKSWRAVEVNLPEGFMGGEWDFKASSQRGFAVVAVHTLDKNAPKDQDLLYVFAVDSKQPRLAHIYQLGDGKGEFRGSIVTGTPRYDFANVAIFPNGGIAASFKDSLHDWSTVAILLDPLQLNRTEIDEVAPRLSNLFDRPDPFSPNGDGRKDESRISFTVDESATIYLDIYKGERLIRSLFDEILPAGVHTAMWDGRNEVGKPVPKGNYEINLWAVDASGNETDEFTATVRLK